MLGALAQRLFGAGRRLVELHALVAVAFGDLLAPHEDPGPHALRAGVAAPDAAGEHGDEEQAEGGDDQDRREQDQVLRPEGCAEDVEAPLRQVPEHGLAAVPLQPEGAEEQQEQHGAAEAAQVAEQSAEALGVDRRADCRQYLGGFAGSDLDDGRGDSFAHSRWPIRRERRGDYRNPTVRETDSDRTAKTVSDGFRGDGAALLRPRLRWSSITFHAGHGSTQNRRGADWAERFCFGEVRIVAER
ncbi:hypothetical protein D9M71_288470 [compost metagenome]